MEKTLILSIAKNRTKTLLPVSMEYDSDIKSDCGIKLILYIVVWKWHSNKQLFQNTRSIMSL